MTAGHLLAVATAAAALFTMTAGSAVAAPTEVGGNAQLRITSPSTVDALPGSVTPLRGIEVRGGDTGARLQVTVATSYGTVALPSTPGVNLMHGERWSGGESVTVTGRIGALNESLAHATLSAPATPGAATITTAVLPENPGKVFSASNSHFYEVVADAGLDWREARQMAASRSFRGQPGYIGTIPSSEVNDLVATRFELSLFWMGAASTDTPDAAVRRSWRWADGPRAGDLLMGCANLTETCHRVGNTTAFTAWRDGEPNNGGGGQVPQSGEWAGVSDNRDGPGRWNDHRPTDRMDGYLVEYGDLAQGSTGFEGVSISRAAVRVHEPLAPPTHVEATAGDGRVVVSFTPARSVDGSGIDYTAAVTPGGTSARCPGSPCTVDGLRNGLQVQASLTATDASGRTATSALSAPITPRGRPSPPARPSTVAVKGGAQVTFEASTDDGGSPITYYLIRSEDGMARARCARSPCTVTGLAGTTARTFTINAVNALGMSAPSPASDPVVPGAVPQRPEQVKVTSHVGSVYVSWRQGNNQTAQATTFVVRYRPVGARRWVQRRCTKQPCEIPGLSGGKRYEFTVSGQNVFGASQSSAAVFATPYRRPGAPTVEAVAANGAVNLHVKPHRRPSEPAVAGHEVAIVARGLIVSSREVRPVHGIIKIEGLEPGARYFFVVRSRTTAGAGAWSEPVTAVPLRQVPPR